MGILRGDVEIVGLGNLLQLLSLNEREGILTLHKGTVKKQFHFGPSGIRLLFSPMRLNKLGKILVRRRHITRADLDALLQEQKILGWKFGKVALTSGLVSKEAIEEALREQIEEEIFDAFMWSEASFEFVDVKEAPHEDDTAFRGVTFEANVTSLVLEASRRADELSQMSKMFHDEEVTLQRTSGKIRAEGLDADLDAVKSVLPLLKERATLREILLASIFPRYATMRAIYAMLAKGYLQAFDRNGSPVDVLPSTSKMRFIKEDPTGRLEAPA